MARPIEISGVEDSPSDVDMTLAALGDARTANVTRVVDDGAEAMAFSCREGENTGVPRPGLVILDLNLPRRDGREVLAEVKFDPVLHRIPVVVLTTEAAEAHILRACDLHANSYVTEPVGCYNFCDDIGDIENFWLSLVRLPVSRVPSDSRPSLRAPSSTQTVDLLRDVGVDAVQGYVIGSPVSAHHVFGQSPGTGGQHEPTS